MSTLIKWQRGLKILEKCIDLLTINCNHTIFHDFPTNIHDGICSAENRKLRPQLLQESGRSKPMPMNHANMEQ